MRVDEKVLKTIVFIGVEAGGRFVPFGSGFVAALSLDGHYLQAFITAKHVIDQIPGDDVFMRVNRRDGGAQVLIARKKDWLGHLDERVDVAVTPGVLPPDVFDVLHIPLDGPTILTEERTSEYDIGLGDEVFVAGMFTARMGDVRNIPIVRIGTIAAMPEEKVRTNYGQHHVYLVEARSIDGLSGSPVFVRRAAVQAGRDGQIKFQQGHMELLLGMLLGHNPVTNPGDTITIARSAAPDAPDERQEVLVPWNTGIGVVLPISYVVEAVNQPTIVDFFREVLAARSEGRVD